MDDQLLKLKDVATYCGVSYQTAWNWHASGKLRTVRAGRGVRVRQTDLNEFIQGHDSIVNAPAVLSKDISGFSQSMEMNTGG